MARRRSLTAVSQMKPTPSARRTVDAIGFDLGDTLVEYEGVPLSWEAEYPAALVAVSAACGFELTPGVLAAACAVLRRFNTRLVPRTHEVGHAEVFGAVLAVSGLRGASVQSSVDVAAEAFFGVFQRRARSYPDVPSVVSRLQAAGTRCGVLTDVPYGMPRRLVVRDLVAAGLSHLEPTLLTSAEVGARKPDPTGLLRLATRLGVCPHDMLYVGNEPKDVEGALAAGMQAALVWRGPGEAPKCGQHHTVANLEPLAVVFDPSNPGVPRSRDPGAARR